MYGGHERGEKNCNHLYRFDVNSKELVFNEGEPYDSLPTLSEPSSTVIGNSIFVYGGYNSDKIAWNTEIMELAFDENHEMKKTLITAEGSIGPERSMPSLFSINGNLHLIFGYNVNSKCDNSLYSFENGEWLKM